MPTPNRGYIYPAISSPATVPADLRAPLEQIDADVQALTDQMGEAVLLNPDGTLPEGVQSQMEAISREFGSPAGMIPIFSTLAEAQSWEAERGRPALTIESPPDPDAWPAAAPLFDQVGRRVVIPDDAGATYRIDGVTVTGSVSVTPPVTITVTAHAKPGYTLAGDTDWTHEFVVILNAYDSAALALSPQYYLRLDEPSGGPYVNMGSVGAEIAVAPTPLQVAGIGGFATSTSLGEGAGSVRIRRTPSTSAFSAAVIVSAEGSHNPWSAPARIGVNRFASRTLLSFSGPTVSAPDQIELPAQTGFVLSHWALTWDGSTVRVYLDGVKVSEFPDSGPMGEQLAIYAAKSLGSGTGGNGLVAAGWVMDLSRAWTEAEVKSLSNAVVR